MNGGRQTVLVIDDEVQILRLLAITLEGAGFTVIDADSGAAGLEEAARCQPDAVILDIGLPDFGGLEVLKKIRESSKVPVLVLTVLGGEEDKVAALDSGADDYLTKPFGAAELTARMRAILRRVQGESEPTQVSFGDVEMDISARIVRKAGAEVRLTAKEYAMLRLLALNRGKVVTHGHMLRELWGQKAEENTHYLRVHMTHIRQKLESEPHKPRYLRTESGIGYRLVDD
ncbi:MAG TPA: response regulator transcription factor [Opitutaceae bacterium]